MGLAVPPTPHPMAKTVIWVHGDKGGTGKTTTAKALAHWLRSLDIPVVGIETDARNPDFHRSYGRELHVERLNVRDEDAWFGMIDVIHDHPEHAVLVDLPAGAGGDLAEYGKPVLDGLADLKRRLWVVWVLNGQPSVLAGLKAGLADLRGYDYRLVLLKNGFFGDDEAFGFLRDEKAVALVKDVGAVVGHFPRLAPSVYDAALAANASFRELLDPDGSPLRYAHRIALARWLKDAADSFGTLASVDPS
jgi:hypothetical protein